MRAAEGKFGLPTYREISNDQHSLGYMEPNLWTEVPLERLFVACEAKEASHMQCSSGDD